ncbi:Crp/Fnr family transcriptional regulator [Halomonas sp. SH5A2]|uniref:Crp/Fnr family transcriptional regulator n=1 Tax=Halomonas sp. SH5A2 TaxID=2749040 RepID=UPI0016402AEB|nr:Crp/Fnr family transcriptional regulator [Halomonas sp. SH5A2]QNI02786.1 Crp/Fnr family transcriptional regulator [Halomonas sp. SH5A2]
MTSIFHVADANQLLAGLPSFEQDAFIVTCETVELAFGEVLLEPTEAVNHVYFPIDSFISLIASLDSNDQLEVAMAGREGMFGTSLVLGVDESPLLALVQGAGTAFRLNAINFQALLLKCPVLHQRLKHYIYIVMRQLSQTAACNHFHRIEERLARWLLMTQDRAGGDQLHLTHEFLAMMLGVRRSGVTLAAISLQNRGLIHYQRGEINILDRPGLIEAACGCYKQDCALYNRILGVV